MSGSGVMAYQVKMQTGVRRDKSYRRTTKLRASRVAPVA